MKDFKNQYNELETYNWIYLNIKLPNYKTNSILNQHKFLKQKKDIVSDEFYIAHQKT